MACAVLVNDNYNELPPLSELPKLVRSERVELPDELPKMFKEPQKKDDMPYDQAQLICEGVIGPQELIDTFGVYIAREKFLEAGRRYKRFLKRRELEEKIPLEIRMSPYFIIDGYINDENDMIVK